MSVVDADLAEAVGVSGLAATLARLDDPCSKCSHASRCAGGLACQAFAQWVSDGKISDTATYIPTKKIYDKIFES